EAEQTYPEVVLRRRVPGRQRQRRLEFDNRLLVTPEPRQGEAAIELRLRMTRYRGQNLVECPEGILRAPQRHERVAALMQAAGAAGLQRQGLVKPLERLLISLERVQHDAEIDPSIWRAGVDPERGSDQPIGFSGLSALSFDRTEEIERVELVGHRLQHPGVDLLRLAQATLLLQRHGIAQRLPEIRQAMRRRYWRRAHVTTKRSKTRDACHPNGAAGHKPRHINNSSAAACPGAAGAPAGNRGSDCKIRGCRQSPPARTSRRLEWCNCKKMSPRPCSCLRTTDVERLGWGEGRPALPPPSQLR